MISAAISNTTFSVVKARGENLPNSAELRHGLQNHQRALVGSFEIEFDTGDFYWSPEMFQLFERNVTQGPLPLVDFLKLLHPEKSFSASDFHPDLLQRSAQLIVAALNIDWFRFRNPLADQNFQVTAGIIPARDKYSAKIVGTVSDVSKLMASEQDSPQSEIAMNCETAKSLSFASQEAAASEERSRIEDRVQYQETLLQSLQEISLDGIVVISHDRRLVSFNQRFRDLWNLPVNLEAGDKYDFVREILLKKVSDPGAYLERIEFLYANPNQTACDKIALNDGRTIERYGAPLHGNDEKYYGRIWYFRDVTDRIYANDQRQAKLLRSRIMKSILAAREDEQRRIARDLHDIIGQSLTSISLGLETAKIESRQALKLSTLEELQKMVAVAVGDVRLLSRNLRPPVLDDLGLIAALNHMLQEHGEQNNLQCHLQYDPAWTRRLPEHLETALFRIAQESLTNIVKHAQATQVNIVLKLTAELVELTISDNGCGFQPEEVLLKGTNGGLGLLGMQERIDLLQGTFELKSSAGEGTTLMITAHFEEKFDVCNSSLHR